MSAIYEKLVQAYHNNLTDDHQVVQYQDYLYKCYNPKLGTRSKQKGDLKFIHIIELLSKDMLMIPKTQQKRKEIIEIVEYMKKQKVKHVESSCFSCIRNLLSKLENLLRGRGFKTSVDMADELLMHLEHEISEPKNVSAFLDLMTHTMLDTYILDRVRQQNDINTANAHRGTILHDLCEAPQFIDPSWITYFVKLGGQINKKDSNNESALYKLLYNFGPKDDEQRKNHIIRLLQAFIKNGANFDEVQCANKETPLIFSLQLPLEVFELIAQNSKKSVNLLVDGKTALHWTCQGNGDAIKMLVELGANLLIKDKDGHIALEWAFMYKVPPEKLKPLLTAEGLQELLKLEHERSREIAKDMGDVEPVLTTIDEFIEKQEYSAEDKKILREEINKVLLKDKSGTSKRQDAAPVF